MRTIMRSLISAAVISLAAVVASGVAFYAGTAQAFTFPAGGGAGSNDFTVDDKLFHNFLCTAANSLCGGVDLRASSGRSPWTRVQSGLGNFDPRPDARCPPRI
jgi:hypothetical protein